MAEANAKTGIFRRRFGIAVLAVVSLLVLATIFLGFSRAGTSVVLRLAQPFLTFSGQTVTITDAGPLLTGHLTAGRITVADKNGAYAEVDDLSIDWHPLALLRLNADIVSIEASRVHVERSPEIPESNAPASSSSSSSGLPVSINIGRLGLPLVELGSSFSGKKEALSVTGAASINSANMGGKVAITDLGSSAAKADLSLNYNPAARSFAIDAKADEAKGGVIAGLLGLPDKPALGFMIKGDGPLENWKGTAAASVEGLPVAQFAASIQKAASGLFAVSLKGGGALDAIASPSLSMLLKGKTDVDLALAIDPAGSLHIDQGKVVTGAVQASLSGNLSLSGNNDFKASVQPAAAGAVFSFGSGDNAIGVDVAGASLEVAGPPQGARIALAAQLNQLTLAQGTLKGIVLNAQSDAFNLKAQSGLVQTELSVAATAFKDDAVQRLAQAPFKLKAPVKVAQDTIAADYSLEGASFGGTGQVTYTVETKGAAAGFKLFAAPSVLPPALGAKISEPVGLSGTLTYVAGALDLKDLAISSTLVSAEGSVSLKDDALIADLSGSLPDLGKFIDKAQGQGTFKLAASGTVSAPSVAVSLDVPKAVLSGKALDKFALEATAALKDGGIDGKVHATGSIAGQTIDVSTLMKQANGRTDIPDIAATIGSNKVTGQMVLDSAFQPQGKLAFDLKDLSLIGAMAGQPLSGALTGGVDIGNTNGDLTARVALSGNSLRYDTTDIAGIGISLDYAAKALSGKVSAKTITSGSNKVDAPVLTFSRSGNQTDFTLAAKYGGAPVDAAGNVAPSGDTTVLHLDRFSATAQKVPVKLGAPTDVTMANGVVQLNGLKVVTGTGALVVTGKAGSALDLQIKIDNLPAALANNFSAGLGADGVISGNVAVTGKAADPKASFSLSWPAASLAATRSAGLPGLALAAKGDYGAGQLAIDATAKGAGLSANANGKLQLSGAKSLAIKVTGAAPLALGQSFVASQGIGLSGNASFDISVSGALTAPRIGGRITLASAGIALPRQNLNLTGMSGTIDLNGQTANISGLTAKVSSGGTIAVNGTVGIAAGSGFPADLAVKLANAVYTDGSLVQSKLSGDLTLKGPMTGGAVLGGTINLGETTITIPEKIPASLAAINLQHRNAPKDVKKQAAELKPDAPKGDSGGGSSAIRLDMAVVAENRMFVRGRGMDAELGGTLKVTGTTAAPIISGSFNMVRGRLAILGKRLDFTSGTISFGGDLIPTLNLIATSSTGSLAVTVTVAGAANNPEIGFSSSPARPQDEVLAQLIFGRSASSLSPLQIAQLADAALQLAGGQSTSVFEKLRKGTGIDDLDVSTDANGNSQVSAGKYLNSRTYLELQQGATSGSGKAIINLDVGKGVKLRGEADSGGGTATGIFYEKEY